MYSAVGWIVSWLHALWDECMVKADVVEGGVCGCVADIIPNVADSLDWYQLQDIHSPLR